MLQYEKIDASEGTDVNKKGLSKEFELCHYWFYLVCHCHYFKDVEFKFEEHICNGCHDLLTTAYSLENIAVLNAKGATFRCILWGISKNESLRRLNSSVLEDKGVMGFSPNKTAIEIIVEGAFGGTYLRDIYSGISRKWYKNSQKKFDHLKNIDQKYYYSDYYDVSVNKSGLKCETSLRFWENKG